VRETDRERGGGGRGRGEPFVFPKIINCSGKIGRSRGSNSLERGLRSVGARCSARAGEFSLFFFPVFFFLFF